DPGYPPARSVFTAAGARVIDVPVDKDGLRVDALPSKARMVYVTPSHQFPLGMPMTLERRLALLEWAHRRGA
ncbi:MAG TPA: DNA-binding protein, partial [Cupriavidus sp.]|nr:DNA-binding protein [Cupriavidus sp.]